MVVIHPEYGLGKIIALGGSGAKRSATVQFADDDTGIENFDWPSALCGRSGKLIATRSMLVSEHETSDADPTMPRMITDLMS